MSNFINIQTLCFQRKQQQLYNIPLPRTTPISPYPTYSQYELDMRRKAEILKYSSNLSSSQTNNLTKNQKFSKIIRGNYRGNVVFCTNDLSLATLSSSCDVPGPITILYNDNNIPIYNLYRTTRVFAGDNNKISDEYYSELYDNVIIPVNTERTIANLYIESNRNSSINSFKIQTPFFFVISGSNIIPNGSLDLQILLSSFSVIVYYSNVQTLTVNGAPTYNYTIQNSPIKLTLLPPDETTPFSFSAFFYGGILNLSNINLFAEPGYIYDIKLSFVVELYSSNNSNSSIINNTSVSIYTNVSKEIFEKINYDGITPFNNYNPYNCSIDSNISNDNYVKANLTSYI
jgi:hypothetical protein